MSHCCSDHTVGLASSERLAQQRWETERSIGLFGYRRLAAALTCYEKLT
jgi:hypothetical protein